MWQVFISVLATWQIIEIWNHSALFAGLRARLELNPGRLSQLLLCPFCLSCWVGPAVIIGVTMVESYVATPWIRFLVLSPVLGLAVARGANLLNDVFYKYSRTPKINRLDWPPDEGTNDGRDKD